MTRLAFHTGGAALFVTALAIAPSNAVAQQPEPISYTVRVPAPRTHYLEVEATYPTGGRPSVELMMAVWTPGSYLVREFARNVEGVSARSADNQPLPIEKSRKNRWLVQTRGAPRVTVSYRVYAHERAGRLDWVDDDFALINGAPTYLTLADQIRRPHEVTLELPAGWARSLTALHPAADGRAHHYRAADFDELVDSPIVAGNPAVHEFTVDGVRHALVNVSTASDSLWDAPRSVAALEEIVRGGKALWGSLPYERYLFFNFLTDSYDGIEHKGSTVLFADRRSTRTDDAYHQWLDLAAHEYTHAWNVKRLRPVELGPFDYEQENHTRSLWIAEGVTDYYAWLLVRRAGLGTLEQGLADVSLAIRALQTTPGRLVQPVELASFDAWIKQYRPDENSINTSISYYTKGSLVGLLLDARIRYLTNGARSLDDVMRLAYSRYSGARGYTPAEFRGVASEVAGANLDVFFHRALETTEEMDYSEMLDWYGLRFTPASAGASNHRGWLGLGTRTSSGRMFITSILRGTPAYGSGLDVGDEILSVDDASLDGGSLDARLAESAPGTRVTFAVARHGEIHRASATLGTAPAESWSLGVRPDATPAQRAHLEAWMGTR